MNRAYAFDKGCTSICIRVEKTETNCACSTEVSIGIDPMYGYMEVAKAELTKGQTAVFHIDPSTYVSTATGERIPFKLTVKGLCPLCSISVAETTDKHKVNYI